MKNWNFPCHLYIFCLLPILVHGIWSKPNWFSKTLHPAYCLKFVESAFAFEVVLPFFGFSCWFLFAILFVVYLWCVKVKHWTWALVLIRLTWRACCFSKHSNGSISLTIDNHIIDQAEIGTSKEASSQTQSEKFPFQVVWSSLDRPYLATTWANLLHVRGTKLEQEWRKLAKTIESVMTTSKLWHN